MNLLSSRKFSVSCSAEEILEKARIQEILKKLKTDIPAPSTLSPAEWPPDYDLVKAWRQQQLDRFEADPTLIDDAKEYYKHHAIDFINDWCDTYDPRRIAEGLPARIPFILFTRQAELIQFLEECVEADAPGLVEKCRDMGATWVCCEFSIHLFLFFEGSAIGWGSRKQEYVDRLGDPSSIFEKMRMTLRCLPEIFLPKGFSFENHSHFMRLVNPENGSSIIGEIGDDIGRGGRTSIFFKDESAHYARPEKIEAALSENTRCPIDISSVNSPNNVFYRKRESGVDWEPGQEVVKNATNVFVMDWSDHPEKTKEWHAARKAQFIADGLEHVFNQEIERNYFAAIQGTMIAPEWFDAAVDAHIKLGIEPSGARMAGFDVADEGRDKNALSIRLGILVQFLSEWGYSRDVGASTRKAISILEDWIIPGNALLASYDCIGIGAGVKAEWNRLIALDDEYGERLAPEELSFSAWNAASAVQDPFKPVVEHLPGDKKDKKPILNKDFFGNFKAQAWWSLARRFQTVFRAVNEKGFVYNPDDIIAIPSTLPLKDKLKKELCQPTMSKNAHLKMIVDKTPEGTRSPNLADCLVINFFPAKGPEEPHIGDGGITVIGGSPKDALGGRQRF